MLVYLLSFLGCLCLYGYLVRQNKNSNHLIYLRIFCATITLFPGINTFVCFVGIIYFLFIQIENLFSISKTKRKTK